MSHPRTLGHLPLVFPPHRVGLFSQGAKPLARCGSVAKEIFRETHGTRDGKNSDQDIGDVGKFFHSVTMRRDYDITRDYVMNSESEPYRPPTE